MLAEHQNAGLSPAGGQRPDLRADCGNCFALCCVALPFTRSADFAADKDAGTPCRNLRADFRCGVHARLREDGFAGCTVFECFSAGQRVSQGTFEGRDWRADPGTAGRMFAVFTVVRGLHELLWYLTEALTLPPARPLHDGLRQALAETERSAASDIETLLALDLAAHRGAVGRLLLRTSELVRAQVPGRRPNHRGADLIGADLRDADLCGADLTGSIFLTQPQLNATKGDVRTRRPRSLTRPAHW